MEAIVFVNVLLAANEIVENAVKTTEGVLASYPTSGIYDLVLKVKAADEEALEKVIKKIQSIRGVAGTLTSIVRQKSVR